MPFTEEHTDETIVSPIAPTKLSAELLERLLGTFVCAHPENPRIVVTAGSGDYDLSVDLEFPRYGLSRLGESLFLGRLLGRFGLRGEAHVYNDQGGFKSVPLAMSFESESSARERLAARATLRTIISNLGENPNHLPFLVHDIPSINSLGNTVLAVERLSPAWLFDVVGSICVLRELGLPGVQIGFNGPEGIAIYESSTNLLKRRIINDRLLQEDIARVFRWFGLQKPKAINEQFGLVLHNENVDLARRRLNECRIAARALAAA